MAISADDARQLADLFHDAAAAISNYLNANFETSDDPDYETLDDLARTLVLRSSEMTTTAVDLAIDEMADDAAELKQVTTAAKESLETLQTIRTVINVATALVGLATAIVSRNPGGAFKAAKELWGTLQPADA